MSASTEKAKRRDIRRAFGSEFEEAVQVFMVAHEQGLRQHGLILNAILLGPAWKRWVWFVFGARVLFWLAPPTVDTKESADGPRS